MAHVTPDLVIAEQALKLTRFWHSFRAPPTLRYGPEQSFSLYNAISPKSGGALGWLHLAITVAMELARASTNKVERIVTN